MSIAHAQRRRGRRLRALWRHEQQSVAMALARVREEGNETNHGPRRQTTPLPTAEFFEPFVCRRLGRMRPDSPGSSDTLRSRSSSQSSIFSNRWTVDATMPQDGGTAGTAMRKLKNNFTRNVLSCIAAVTMSGRTGERAMPCYKCTTKQARSVLCCVTRQRGRSSAISTSRLLQVTAN